MRWSADPRTTLSMTTSCTATSAAAATADLPNHDDRKTFIYSAWHEDGIERSDGTLQVSLCEPEGTLLVRREVSLGHGQRDRELDEVRVGGQRRGGCRGLLEAVITRI